MRVWKLVPVFMLTLSVATFVYADANSAGKAAHANETAVRQVYARWAEAFTAHNLDAIMSLYGPQDQVVAYDWIPPLQRRGLASYRESYRQLLDQYNGPIAVEFRDLRVVAGSDVAFIHKGNGKGGAKKKNFFTTTPGP